MATLCPSSIPAGGASANITSKRATAVDHAMNVEVVAPHWRASVPDHARRITSVAPMGPYVVAGLDNGDVGVFQPPQPAEPAQSRNACIIHKNVTGDHSAVAKVMEVVPEPFGDDISPKKTVVGVVTADNRLLLVELVGTQFNCMAAIDDGGVASTFDKDTYTLAVDHPKSGIELFKVGHKSRNVLLLTSQASWTSKERIKAMQWIGPGLLFVALADSLAIATHSSENHLEVEILPQPRLPQASSRSYFRRSGPEVWISPKQRYDNYVYVVKGSNVLQINADRQVRYHMKLSHTPSTVTFLPGLLIAVTQNKVEIVNLATATLMQSLPQKLSSKPTANSTVLAGNSEVMTLRINDRVHVCRSLVSSQIPGGVNHAIAYFEANAIDDQSDRDRLRQLYWRKAMDLWQRHNYKEALAVCREWLLPYSAVIQLFPKFLADPDAKPLPSSSPNQFAVKQSSFNSLTPESLADFVSQAPTPANSVRSLKSTESRKVAPFVTAVTGLVGYLTEMRRILANFASNNSVEWKHHQVSFDEIFGIGATTTPTFEQVAANVDTSLFLCYYYTRPILLGPFLRLANNQARSSVVGELLDPSTHLAETLDFYFTRGKHREVLEMLHQLSHDRGLSPEVTINYLQRLDNSHLEIVFKFAYWVLTEASGESEVAGQSEREEYARQIFMNHTSACDSYEPLKVLDYLLTVVKSDDCAIDYLEWILLDSPRPGASSASRLHTQLVWLYLGKLKSARTEMDLKNFECSPFYLKLYRYLDHHDNYEPYKVLKAIPDDDWFQRFAVFVYRKLGDHTKAVEVLYHRLHDLEAVSDYCGDLYTKEPETTKELLHKVLDDVISNDDETIDAVAQLLDTHGGKMDVLRVLISLPQSFPLAPLYGYLQGVYRQSRQELSQTAVAANLYQVGSHHVDTKLTKEKSKGYVVESGTECAICHKKLGLSVAAIKDDEVVHYGCATRK
ncbi:hypothetical protein DIURU_000193 [Diutina rugosa]|uniref:CNH domain-containing protein n=1 Tax=Diutina rugosa TaxID=5481 RepID=A0A642V4C9_DIURU|nr:uncharacterized protein DIURU_000193 [Diutina rugosa]KAA8908404.1 hypothetical protein DIURU_000193 [Diutina rugosa]